MKNNIISLMLLFAAFLQFSCSSNDPESDGLPYYQFTQAEATKLINEPKIGDEIIYKNQEKELLKFKVYRSKKGKTTYSTGSFWGSYSNKHFHYDRQELAMWYAEGYTASGCEITIQKYPIGSNYQTQFPVLGTPKFYGYFTFPLWNGYNGTDIHNETIAINFDIPTINMTFNGKTYSKVIKIESHKTEVLNPSNALPFYPRNVAIIYYDFNYGIIGFDDLNGKLWRLQ